MNKIFLSLGLFLSFTCSAFALDNAVDQLNTRVVDILAPFQNEATVAQLTFNALETNAEHADKVAINSLYSKISSKNHLTIKIANLSYNYNEGTSPQIILKGSVGIDLTKLMPAEMLNAFLDNAITYLKNLAGDYSEDFGDAATFIGVVTSTTKDSEGNYTGLSALISAKIDLSKLPKDKPVDDVIATDAVVSFTINTKKGVKLDAFVLSNPEYKGFKEDQRGLKEHLDKLLAGDPEEMDMIKEIIQQLDDMATLIVNY